MYFRNLFYAGILPLFLVGIVLANTSIAQKIYKSDTGAPGGSAHSMMVTYAKMAKRAGINIQINASKTLTVSTYQAGKGKIDFYTGVPFFYKAMKKKIAMYRKKKDAPEVAKKIRYIFSYPAGLTHFLVYNNSGIRSFKDFIRSFFLIFLFFLLQIKIHKNILKN